MSKAGFPWKIAPAGRMPTANYLTASKKLPRKSDSERLECAREGVLPTWNALTGAL